MLKRFVVTNFKNFSQRTEFVLGNPSNYEFNSDIIRNDTLMKSIIYGINGSGKSNLGLALFDIIFNLTDKAKLFLKYQPYLNLDSKKDIAEFEYHFDFDGIEVDYLYGKKDVQTLTYEKLLINNEEVLQFDFLSNSGYSALKGSETLTLNFNSPELVLMNSISRVKYVKNNAILKDIPENRAFKSFVEFVDNMLLFFSVDGNGYQGFWVGSESYTQGIVREKKIKEFEEFLKKYGISYNLISVNYNGVPDLFCQFEKEAVPFLSVASTGTRSLGLFYYWFIKMSKVSFVYLDEFDAFYHFDLSHALVDLLKELKDTQVILSTHNTGLMSNDVLRPDAYFIIQNDTIKPMDKLVDKDIRKAHNIEKMYRAGSFND